MRKQEITNVAPIPESVQASRYKFRRLRAMSIPEMVYRLRTTIQSRIKRYPRPGQSKWMTENRFIKKLTIRYAHTKNRTELRNLLFSDFQARRFFPWQTQPAELIRKLFIEHFPDALAALQSHAEAVLDHRFQFFELAEKKFAGPIDWHWDFLGQKSIPREHWTRINYYRPDQVQDVKYAWELNRHQHLIALGQAYFVTNEEKYAAEACGQLHDWLDANPPGLGINWCSSLELSIRLISWTWTLSFIRTSPSLTPDLYTEILKAVHAHGQHIAHHLSRYSSANNHLIGETVGLIYAGTYFPELKNARHWRNRGFHMLSEEILRQVHPDGVSREQAVHYQMFVLDFILLALIADRDHNALFHSVAVNFRTMLDFLLHLTDCNGGIPHIGDADDGQAIRLDLAKTPAALPYLNFAAAWFNDQVFKPDFAKMDAKTFWLLGVHGLENFEKLPVRAEKIAGKNFPAGGYLILRSNSQSDETILTFDYGPLGLGPLAAHGHADALSLTLRHNGEPLLIDPGTFRYLGGGAWRRYFQSTAAHNTATVAGLNQSEWLGPFMWGKKANVRLDQYLEQPQSTEISAHHSGFKKLGVSVIHQRKLIALWPDSWIVEDQFSGSGEHPIHIHFHLGPSAQPIVREDNLFVCRFEQVTLVIEPMVTDYQAQVITGQENPMMGWASQKYGEKFPIQVLILAYQGKLPSTCRVKLTLKKHFAEPIEAFPAEQRDKIKAESGPKKKTKTKGR